MPALVEMRHKIGYIVIKTAEIAETETIQTVCNLATDVIFELEGRLCSANESIARGKITKLSDSSIGDLMDLISGKTLQRLKTTVDGNIPSGRMIRLAYLVRKNILLFQA